MVLFFLACENFGTTHSPPAPVRFFVVVVVVVFSGD